MFLIKREIIKDIVSEGNAILHAFNYELSFNWMYCIFQRYFRQTGQRQIRLYVRPGWQIRNCSTSLIGEHRLEALLLDVFRGKLSKHSLTLSTWYIQVPLNNAFVAQFAFILYAAIVYTKACFHFLHWFCMLVANNCTSEITTKLNRWFPQFAWYVLPPCTKLIINSAFKSREHAALNIKSNYPHSLN